MWNRVKDLLPIAVAMLSIVGTIYFIGSYIGTMNAKIDATDKKVDALKSDVTPYTTKFFDSVEGKDGLRSQVNKIESKIGTIDTPAPKVNDAKINNALLTAF